MKKLKYALYSTPFPGVEEGELVLAGLYQWAQAFQKYGAGGKMIPSLHPSMVDEFDIVHINYNNRKANYVTRLRDTLNTLKELKGKTSTIIILNVDHALGMWDAHDPLTMREMAKKVDFIFHVEPHGSKALEHLIGQTVVTMAHPVDVDRIMPLKESYGREPLIVDGKEVPSIVNIGAIYHRYLNSQANMYNSLYKLREEYPEIFAYLLNFSDHPPTFPPVEHLYDALVDRTSNYKGYLKLLGNMYCCLDMQPDCTFGRTIVECAALGVPCVGSSTIDSMQRIWPMLATEWYNIKGIEDRVRLLLEHPDFYGRMVERGLKECKYYSQENCHNRLVSELEKRDLV